MFGKAVDWCISRVLRFLGSRCAPAWLLDPLLRRQFVLTAGDRRDWIRDGHQLLRSPAEIQTIVGPDVYGMVPPASVLTAEDIAPIVAAVVRDGRLDKADIEWSTPRPTNSMFSGPGRSWQRTAPLHDPEPDREDDGGPPHAVYKAATTARLSIQHLGVKYTAADCASLQQAATDKAVADARARGERLAKSLNVELGDMVQAMDSIYGGGVPDSCATPGMQSYYGPYGENMLSPYDPTNAVEATATATITVTFEMTATAGATPVP